MTVAPLIAPARGLDGELQRLRLLLRRRVLWLRAGWAGDPLSGHGPLVVSDEQADALATPPDRAAQQAFYREHAPASALSDELDALEHELGLARAERPGPLDRLVSAFELGPFERDLLVLCAGPELDPGMGALYAYVQDDASRRHATPALALDLLPGATRAALAEPAPLRRFRLLTLDEPRGVAWPLRPLRMDERVVDQLRGEAAPDGRVRDALQAVRAAPPAGADAELVRPLAAELARRAGAGVWPCVNLTGPAHAGKRGVAVAACGLLGLRLLELDAAAADGEAALLAREAALLGLAFLVDAGGERHGPALALAEQVEAPLVLLSEEPVPLRRDLLSLRLERPEAASRAELWRDALGPAADEVELDRLVQQFEIGAGAIAEVAADAAARARLRTGEAGAPPAHSDVWAACRERARPHMGELARRVVPKAGWDDIVLPEGTRRQLEDVASQAVERGRVYDTWGFGERLGRGRGISALFAGPSGTGKTMAAEVLADRLELDLFSCDLAGLVSKYIGETEKNLRRVFDAADDSGAILFFDEAEALFGKRTEVRDSHDRYANIEVDYLLQRMEDYRGIAILATNRKNLLDAAFLRRLRFLLDFPFPDGPARRRMWERAFPAAAPVEELDLDALARLEVSGGSIRTIALNAAFQAAAAGSAIGMEHVVAAARREYAKLGKLVTEAEFGEEAA